MSGFKTTTFRWLLALSISLAALTARDVTAAEDALLVHVAIQVSPLAWRTR